MPFIRLCANFVEKLSDRAPSVAQHRSPENICFLSAIRFHDNRASRVIPKQDLLLKTRLAVLLRADTEFFNEIRHFRTVEHGFRYARPCPASCHCTE